VDFIVLCRKIDRFFYCVAVEFFWLTRVNGGTGRILSVGKDALPG
jgi:hypothetical protein